jgi:glycosyltransferase involved in cell wall biosynthesis
VNVFHHPITKNPIAYLNRKYFNLPDERSIFLTAYDVNSIRQRKNPEGAIEAFKKAFEKNDHSVLLLVKINSATADEIEFMQAKIGSWENIRLISNTLDRLEMDSLLNSVDCFVSLHRSEGFGLAIAEAMVLGKPVLATAWSGNVDFVGEAYPFSVNYTLTKLAETYGPYKVGQLWAEPDIAHAAQLMQKIAVNRAWAAQVAANEEGRVTRLLSPENIGKLMEERVLGIESAYSII